MNKQTSGLTIAVPMTAIILCGLAYGQQLQAQEEPFVVPQRVVEYLDQEVEKRAQKVEEWQSFARLTLCLTLSVGLLGIAVSALQAHKHPRMATVVLGVTISCLTLIRTEVFKIDYHTYKQAIMKAERHISEANGQMAWAQSARNAEEWEIHVGMVNQTVNDIDAIEDELLGADSSGLALEQEPTRRAALGESSVLDRTVGAVLAASTLFVGRAEAAEGAPGWIAEAPRSRDAIYFVGHATNASLKQGGEASYQAARQKAERFFAKLAVRLLKGQKTAIDTQALASYLLKSAEVSNTHYTREPANMYGHYTLLKLSRKSLVTDLKFFGIKARTAVPESVVEAFQKVRLPSAAS